VTFLQVVVPSRTRVTAYQDLKDDIDRLIGMINGRFTQTGWTPIHYIFRPLSKTELIALYRESQIGLVTPLKDGMNLVAKEFCACSIDDKGCLILSEFAGAASQLGNGAIIVNPFDLEGTAEAIHRAFTMDEEEQQQRMRKMRRAIKRDDLFKWVDSFLKFSTDMELKDFPKYHEYETKAYLRAPTTPPSSEEEKPIPPKLQPTPSEQIKEERSPE
jgi:trehalose 6-phosphate synthase